MRSTGVWERQRLSSLLERAVCREAAMWKAYAPRTPSSQDTDISPAQREQVVRWLTEVHGRLELHPDTLVLSVCLLDRFLGPLKARPKYLRCIAISCFFLAAKTCEEDECVPSLRALVQTSGCGCSVSDVLRMERLVLDRLDWNLHSATPLCFLHIFHAMVLSWRPAMLDSKRGVSRSEHLAALTHTLYICLALLTHTQVRGSMMALALLSLDMETCLSDWLLISIQLLSRTQMDSSELIRCRELVSRSLSNERASLPPNTVYIYLSQHAPCLSDPTAGGAALSDQTIPVQNHMQTVPVRGKTSSKRKVQQVQVDDFFDGIKRLYNEDVTAHVQEGAPAAASSVLSSRRQEGSASPCPPLQASSAP